MKKYWYFFLFLHKNMLWLLIKCLTKAFLMSTQNIYFVVEKKKKYLKDIPSYLEVCWT